MPRKRNERPVSVAVFEGSDGWWHGYLTVGRKSNGKPDRRHRRGRTREECERKIRELEDQRAANKVTAPGRVPTLAQWLEHWLTDIVSDLRYSTIENSYGWAVRVHLIPGLGAHRLDELTPEDVDTFYRRLTAPKPKGAGLSPSSAHSIHRVLRTALGEAVRRGKIPSNPVDLARAPRVPVTEIDPPTVDEARRILAVVQSRRNGLRWSIGLALGPRQGEVLGLRWCPCPPRGHPDKPARSLLCPATGAIWLATQLGRHRWRHGCDDPHACGYQRQRGEAWTLHRFQPCPQPCRRHRKAKHGCPPPCPPDCTGHARGCPRRTGGGLVDEDVKSAAGRRKLILPPPLAAEVRAHRAAQAAERLACGSAWVDPDRVFTSAVGAPIDSTADWREWKAILAEAGVRPARVHDGRHLGATLLLLKGVDQRTVMDLMGWRNAGMVRRYQHVVDELRVEAARRVGEALWPESAGATDHATAAVDAPTVATRRGRRAAR